MDELRELLLEQKKIIASLKETSAQMRRQATTPPKLLSTARGLVLLSMAEGLIAAHKAARIDNDGLTLDLIEDAMRRVGERLAEETGDGRKFSRKRLGPV